MHLHDTEADFDDADSGLLQTVSVFLLDCGITFQKMIIFIETLCCNPICMCCCIVTPHFVFSDVELAYQIPQCTSPLRNDVLMSPHTSVRH
jgi:hypothetical protein